MTNNVEILKERDQILTGLLYAVASSPVLNPELILQGGGALHFVYSSPRYSSDLDFVFPNFILKADEAISELLNNTKIDEKMFYLPRLAKRDTSYARIAYDPPMEQGIVAKIELKDIPAEEFAPSQGVFHPLLVESPKELYADKVVATLHRMETRQLLKSTDLFDLDYINDNLDGKATDDKIERKAATYNYLGWSRENAEAVIRNITNPANHELFRKLLRKTLLPDVYANRKFDSAFFENTARHFESLRKI